jgi:putative DNA primase/helicase
MSAAELRGAAPHELTILRPVDDRRLMTKTYTIASDGRVGRREFSDAKTFSVELVPVENLVGLHRLLLDLETDPRAFIIRGAPKATTDLQRTPRTLRKGGGAFADTPRAWIMLDADKVALPAGSSVLSDPEDVARYLVDLFAGFAPELEGATAIVQFSSSAGIAERAEAEISSGLPDRWGDLAKGADKISAHIWFWLDVPADGAELTRWAKAINERVGYKVVDPATLNAIQAHYTAAPIFGAGLHDPLKGRRTVIVQGATDAVTLDIPAEAPRPIYTGGTNAIAGLGFAARLEAIGGPDGFHGPINSAVASYIATNWPAPDVDALIETLRARILSADPGSRSTSEIERYASPEKLRERIEAIIGFQQDKAEAERREREAAEAVAPTFPDRGVTLAEAQHQAAEIVDRFADRLRAGERPELLLQMTVGGGKTEAAVKGAVTLLEAARAGGGEEAQDRALIFLVPRHDLGGEIVARIAEAHPGQPIAVWRGMDADDPEQPGKTMCLDPELSSAAGAAGLAKSDVCVACPLNTSCGYQRQRKQRADIWIGAHNLAFHSKPQPIRGAAVAVIDEGFWSAAIAGQDGRPPQLALSALDDDRTGSVTGIARDRLIYLRRCAARALREHEAGGLLRTAFEAEYFTAESAREWVKLEWQMQPKAAFPEGMDRAAIMSALQDAAGSGFTRLRPMLARYVAELLEGTATRSVNATFAPDADLGRDQGSGPAVQFAWREDFAEWIADAPKLFLDATTAPEVLRAWSPDMDVETIEISAPRQRVRQAIGKEFGRAFFDQNPGNVSRLADLVLVELAEASGGDVLVIAQARVKALLLQELAGTRQLVEATEGDPEKNVILTMRGGARLHLAHHGAITGMNRWQDVARMLVVGRPAVNRLDGERLGEIIRGGPVERVQAGNRAHWQRTKAGVRMADGAGVAIEQPHHPDPLVEALRWSITEGSVLQAIGRARGVRRTDPVAVTILGNLALPLTVAEVTTWDELLPDRLMVAAAEAALTGKPLPLAPADMATARPDLWPTPKAAERFLEGRSKTPQTLIEGSYKELGGFKALNPARYRKPGARRWSSALVPAEGGKAALEALLGDLVAFELVEAVPERQPAPAPEPVGTVVHVVGVALTLGSPTGVIVMGADPPFDVPAAPAKPPARQLPLVAAVPTGISPEAVERLRLASARLEDVRPPRPWGDFTDTLRHERWQIRCAAARARHQRTALQCVRA